ncbi:MAG: lipoyl synthase [candidate division WOR-3 bacterium]|nr:lipoyl synthase [candidate division WOR-3 bacterium]
MKPAWLKIKLPASANYELVKKKLNSAKLNTICISGQCPNRIHCWQNRHMTFMILGNICTRNCKFCAVPTGRPNGYIDETEPLRISEIVEMLNLSYVVITSVTRDDLSDGGADEFAKTIRLIKKTDKNIKVEVLVPDFSGSTSAISKVIDAGCDVLAHNLETVERLTPVVRDPKASYQLSLQVLKTAREIKPGLVTKSGFMLGLGETDQEVKATINDLLAVKVNILTIGQYLQPDKRCLPVQEYISPQRFLEYKNYALEKGLTKVVAGPLVRSSYME